MVRIFKERRAAAEQWHEINVGAAKANRFRGTESERNRDGVERKQAVGSELSEQSHRLNRSHLHNLLLDQLRYSHLLGNVLGDEVVTPGAAECGPKNVAKTEVPLLRQQLRYCHRRWRLARAGPRSSQGRPGRSCESNAAGLTLGRSSGTGVERRQAFSCAN